MQYLPAVPTVEGAPVPSAEAVQARFARVDRANAELQAAGSWVFAGGLLPAGSATVVGWRADDHHDRRPFAETKEHLGGPISTRPSRGPRSAHGRAGRRWPFDEYSMDLQRRRSHLDPGKAGG